MAKLKFSSVLAGLLFRWWTDIIDATYMALLFKINTCSSSE